MYIWVFVHINVKIVSDGTNKRLIYWNIGNLFMEYLFHHLLEGANKLIWLVRLFAIIQGYLIERTLEDYEDILLFLSMYCNSS